MPYFECESCGYIASENPPDATRPTRCPGCGKTDAQRPESRLTAAPDSLEFDRPELDSRRKPLPDKVGRFSIRRVLGRGGFGVVYLAWDPSLDREVAVKVSRHDRLGPSALEQMVFEARTAAQLRHANIIAIHEVQVRDNEVCIVADYIEGMSLADKLREGQPAIRKAVLWCLKLARALDHAHERQVVHRDLKPANILVDRNDEPMIADFGLARRQVLGSSGSHPSDEDRYAGSRAGTPGYMSPEQAASMSQEATPASDIYSLGVILYEMLAGTRPFTGSAPEVIRATVLSDPPRLRKINRNVPRELEFVCMKCLEKAPERRYQSGSELARDLELFLAGELERGGVWANIRRHWGRLHRQRKPIAVGVVLALVAIYGIRQFMVWKSQQANLCRIYLETEPRGAEIILVPVDPLSGQLQLDQAIRPEKDNRYLLTVPAGLYLVEAWLPDIGVQEVYRTVSKSPLELIPQEANSKTGHRARGMEGMDEDGRIILPRIRILLTKDASQWSRFDGGEFETGSDVMAMFPLQKTQVAPFFIQRQETTYGEFLDVMGRAPVGSLRLGAATRPDPGSPAGYVAFHEALEYAERIGARLPMLDEYLFAATNGGKTKYPWGDGLPVPKIEEWAWDIEAVTIPEYDRNQHNPPVEGLYSRVAEWTGTIPQKKLHLRHPETGMKRELAEMRFVIGGGPSVLAGHPNPAEFTLGPRGFLVHPTEQTDRGLGFRCARSERPRFVDIDTGDGSE
jgi:formylglycine-generating enzyme required for sulfatase activity